MTLAFVVPVTRPDLCRALVERLFPVAGKKGWEIILVAGGIIPGVEGMARCVTTPDRHASIRRNLGVRATQAEWIAFLDDDTLPTERWFSELDRALEGPAPIVTGPTIPMTDTFDERLADLITTSPLGEGSLLYSSRDGSSPSFSSIYLCNCLVKREVWERVGGFNEVADWRVDDTEFFFIASRLGFRPLFRRGFAVRHLRRGYFNGFLKHQFKARFATGMNTVLFPEIFLRIPGVLIMTAGLGLLPVILAIPRVLHAAVLLYALALVLDPLYRVWRHGVPALFLPPAHMVHHAVIGSAFILGLLGAIFTRSRYRPVLDHQRERYRVLS